MKPIVLAIILLFSSATAQLRSKGEFELGSSFTATSFNDVWSDQFALTMRVHLEADYDVSPFSFRVVLDPTLSINGSDIDQAIFEPGLTEAFALYRLDNSDISVGLERLPLEYARLTVPYRLEPVGKTGQALGLIGARASIFLNEWRIRPAVVYKWQDEQLGGVLSVRRDFFDFELEAHFSYLDDEFALGLGGSGLYNDIVLYGEAWLLSNPWDARAAFGLSGFWDDRLWTVEAAYADSQLFPSTRAFPQLLSQLNIPYSDTLSFDLNANLAYLENPLTSNEQLAALARASANFSESDYSVNTGGFALFSDTTQILGIDFRFTSFF